MNGAISNQSKTTKLNLMKTITRSRPVFNKVAEIIYLLIVPALLIAIDVLLYLNEPSQIFTGLNDEGITITLITLHVLVSWIFIYMLNRMFTFKFTIEPIIGLASAWNFREKEGYVCLGCFCMKAEYDRRLRL